MKFLLFILFATSICSELRGESTLMIERRLQDSGMSYTSCGTWQSECNAYESYGFTMKLQQKGTGSAKAILYALTTTTYNNTDCTGDIIVQEVVQFEDIDYAVNDQYPQKVTMKRNIATYSIVFNDWVYFVYPVTCTSMELGQSYEFDEVNCVYTSSGGNVLENLNAANETEYSIRFYDSYLLLDGSNIQLQKQSTDGCNTTSAGYIVGIAILCVAIIAVGAIALVLVIRSEPKKGDKKGDKKDDKKSEKSKDEVKVAVEPKTEEPKAEEAKAEEPKAEEPKTEEPKAEEAKAEEPKTEEPKAEEPKAEEPKAEEPKAEEPKTEEPKTEEPKAEEPKAEEPKAEEPKAEEPKAEEPKAEEPKAEEPKAEEGKTNDSVTNTSA